MSPRKDIKGGEGTPSFTLTRRSCSLYTVVEAKIYYMKEHTECMELPHTGSNRTVVFNKTLGVAVGVVC